MKYRYAKKLHNEDEVTVKKTKEVVRVITTEVHDKEVIIYAVTREEGYTQLRHTDIS